VLVCCVQTYAPIKYIVAPVHRHKDCKCDGTCHNNSEWRYPFAYHFFHWQVLEHLMDHAQKEGLLDEMLRQTDQYGRSVSVELVASSYVSCDMSLKERFFLTRTRMQLRHVAATQVVASIVSNYEKMGARPTRSNFRAQAEIEEKNVSSSRTHWSVLGPMIRTVAALRVKRAR
jgi:hypothetical protein